MGAEFVKRDFERVFEEAVAEIADEDDGGEADEVDEEDGVVEVKEAVGKATDELEDEEVSEVDGVGPVAESFECVREADEMVTFELYGSEKEERGEGAVEDGALPGGIGDPVGLASVGVVAVGDDCGEPDYGCDEKCGAGCSGHAMLAIELEEDAAGDELEDCGAGEELNYG